MQSRQFHNDQSHPRRDIQRKCHAAIVLDFHLNRPNRRMSVRAGSLNFYTVYKNTFN